MMSTNIEAVGEKSPERLTQLVELLFVNKAHRHDLKRVASCLREEFVSETSTDIEKTLTAITTYENTFIPNAENNTKSMAAEVSELRRVLSPDEAKYATKLGRANYQCRALDPNHVEGKYVGENKDVNLQLSQLDKKREVLRTLLHTATYKAETESNNEHTAN
jgi:hypothetical protein